jgi:aminopeptidase N
MSRIARAPRVLALLTLAVLAATTLGATAALAAPRAYPMPDGSTLVRDDLDVAPYLAAWKARALGRERAVATAATANQQSYDARWYDLNLTFTPSTSTVSGTVRMKATVVTGPLSTVDLDFYANLVVDSATSGGVAATWTRSGNVLTLALDRPYDEGETVDVTVTYHGVPTAAGYFGFTTYYSRQLIWSLSEAYGSRTWWPCKDSPDDKADSVDVHFTCPSALTTISNGTLVSTVNNGSTVTTSWRERYPIATYLVFIASYPYTVVSDWYVGTAGDSLPLRFNVSPERASAAASVDAMVKQMIAAYAGRMGEYPFMGEKYGHAEFTFSGGMEHQTTTCLGGNAYIESVVAHELMHQWWGDMVTCNDFHHIWVNEGFATYGEALWSESQGGASAYQADMAASAYYGSGTIYVPDASDETRVFDSNLSYNKGSWVLHMLRHVLGDSVFFQALRDYRAAHGYRSATTENFRDVCEATSGRNLHDFFEQWIYGEYYPQYSAGWSAAAAAGGGYDVTLSLLQTQGWQLFHMPVDITVTTPGTVVTFVVDDSLAAQTFVLHVDAVPSMVEIDRDSWILKTLDTVVANPTFERGVLLVNGVDWSNYGTEITSAYTDKAFWGDYAIDFWDAFATPAAGYPSTLPAPLGHGAVPADLLGHYRAVVWIGNNYNGDLAAWQSTPVLSYLRAGGNVLLMSRMGDQFLGDSLKAYLGVNWTSTSATLYDCVATRPGFVNQALLSSQTYCSVFDSTRTTTESTLLFKVSTNFSPNRGIGAIRVPSGGMGARSVGGRLAFLSGRPYRWNHTQLRANVMNLLNAWFLEPVAWVGVEPAAPPIRPQLLAARPNPSRGSITLRFTLPRAGQARLVVLDVGGRRVRTLLDGAMGGGEHEIAWDGRAENGRSAPAGVYWARLEADATACTRRLVRVR